MTNAILTQLENTGFAEIPPEFYRLSSNDNHFLEDLQETYRSLPADLNGGNRFRTYNYWNWRQEDDDFLKNKSKEYWQSSEYNYVDGGATRVFEPISDRVSENPLVKFLLKKDIELAKQTGVVEFDETLIMINHQIRYAAKMNQASVASPIWLHRDDEPLIFIHLINMTDNALGADLVIAPDHRTVSHVIRLNKPFQTLLLTKKDLHALTPLGSADGKPACRDVFLVPFINKKQMVSQ